MSEENSSLILRPSSSDIGKRLDAFLAENVEGWSRVRLRRLIDYGDVLVNNKESKPSYKVRENDEIEVELIEIPTARFEPENISLDIIFEDESLAVINKPAGMVVHPGAGVTSGTLANAVAYHFGFRVLDFGTKISDEQSKIQNLKSKIGIVHRLDKHTSGLIVIAKNEEMHEALSEHFRNRKVEKSYVALVHGVTRENSGKVDQPIARDRRNRLKMTVSQTGRSALTLWKVRQRFEKFTLLDVEIKTGRTHQIRVHLASINHPVAGDATYNEGRDNTIADTKIRTAIKDLGRVFLHAERLSFTHPKTGERLLFTVEMPAELKQFLDLL
ncbi:MAG TPA: RluA family pseudouridine synthase [Pyrinomonadaceae bacterium]|nr:RluA family pseudouridine synthase [Pyrinomonadaceae bacterium]